MATKTKTKTARRPRRTREQLNAIEAALIEIIEPHAPMTARQIFYQAVSKGVIGKTEGEYKNTVIRLLASMRRSGRIPYWWIADNTRWQRKPRTFSSIEDALERTQDYYRRDLWQSQSDYVEVWCEKDALAGVLYEVTSPWHVPLMVTKGFASISYLYEAAETIKAADKPAWLYYFGDRDPSGVHIDRSIEKQLRLLAPEAEIHFERVAVTPKQIGELGLQTRPTKLTDSRCKGFEGESVEVDAIPPDVLKEMAESCITRHIDYLALQRLQVVERLERDTLARFTGLDCDGLAAIADRELL